MEFLQQRFQVRYDYKVFFTNQLFDEKNDTIRAFFRQIVARDIRPRVLVVIDEGVLDCHPTLATDIKQYFTSITEVSLVDELLIVPGGEQVKNTEEWFYRIIDAVDKQGIDRHSYIVGLGGGSVLDVVGFAAAVSHRGIRHIRIPTTVLSQNDSGVGVKNGINFFRKKNFLGTFATPVAVFNDSHFMTTLNHAEWRSGISEAIKVALIKDEAFFVWLEENADKLVNRDGEAMHYLIYRCAELHLQHIASGDPFESGSSRPLDFGHWSAHKLEQLSGFSIRHGEAVALGIALDSVYSFLSGRLNVEALNRIVSLIHTLGFKITHPLLAVTDDSSPLLDGLNEFREHLGGKLTIMLLRSIGKGEEVHEMDATLVRQAYEWLVDHQEINIPR